MQENLFDGPNGRTQPHGYIITLTEREIIGAALEGVLRVKECILGQSVDPYKGPRDTIWQRHIEGALAECAFAKYYNSYWSGRQGRGSSDASGHEIRNSRYDDAHLLLHPKDNDAARHWLVTGFNGRYVIRGWIFGRDGKQKKYWRDAISNGRFAFFVPQEDLEPGELPFED